MLPEHQAASRRVGTSAGGASQAPENPRECVKMHRAALTPSNIAFDNFLASGRGFWFSARLSFQLALPYFYFII